MIMLQAAPPSVVEDPVLRFPHAAVASCGDAWGPMGRGNPRDQSDVNGISPMEKKGGRQS